MTEYKSEVKTIYASQEAVYNKLSDLSNLAVIQQHLDDPAMKERILRQAGDKVSPSQMDTIVEQLRKLQFDRDSVSGHSPIGEIALRIIEREDPKTVKFAVEGSPIPANMWIQLLPATENQCALRLTVKADMNFLVRQMVGGKLQQGVDSLATMLAQLPY